MGKKLYYIIFITLGIGFFVSGFVIEILDFNIESCWVIAATILCFVFAFVPISIKRINKRRYSKFLNFIIVFSAVYLIAFGAFIMANLLYFAIWGAKLWDGYTAVMYPGIIIYCLLECYIDYNRYERYKNSEDYDY